MKLFTVSNNHTTRTVPYVAEIGSIWTMVVLKPEQGGKSATSRVFSSSIVGIFCSWDSKMILQY